MPQRTDPPASHTDDDADLFRREMGDVRPIRDDRHRPDRPRPPARAHMRDRDEQSVLDELDSGPIDWMAVETGEELGFLREGVNKRVLKKLRRGQYAVQGQLDLHQMNLEAARLSIDNFLADALERGATCVKIIHGKGLRSKSGPVLKNLTNSLLRRRKPVLAFTSTPPHDGGTGAVYVLLKRL